MKYENCIKIEETDGFYYKFMVNGGSLNNLFVSNKGRINYGSVELPILMLYRAALDEFRVYGNFNIETHIVIIPNYII